MKNTLILSTLILISLTSWSQEPLNYKIENSTWEYSVITPPGKSKGLIIFIPGFTQTAASLLETTPFQNMAYMYGLTTVVIPCGSKLYADGDVVKTLNSIVRHVISDQNIPKDKVILGGFSAGGTIALRYAQYAIKYHSDYPIIPQAVFTVDPPTDLTLLYEYSLREIDKNFSEAGVNEARFIKNLMERELKGTPETAAQRYADLSPFNLNEPYGGNARILQNIPVRCYHDADVIWQLQQRRRSLRDMNVFGTSEMINQLLLAGNKNAELILATGKGMRNDERHPHSMSIVDEQELMLWILKSLNIPANTSIQNHFKSSK